MKKRPRIADVKLSKVPLRPGDRVIAKVYEDYPPREMAKIKKMIERWAGDGVEVLVINALKMEVIIERQ